ncbi:MAG: response regulator transcription factor [Saprospiraceae bacterium]|nr:response regulator transcription factor [Saprospiraceae bacterium]MCB9309896.1 response regulator transcription factor [Lewinellaceae bacterium]
MIQCIIIDDEPLALDILENYIQRLPNLNLIGRCENAIQANEIIQNHKVDLMFLDIQMPGLTGIEFLKALKNPPLVIFTTAHADFAVQGFELDAIDYLLKPISMERFLRAVNKATEKIHAQQPASEKKEEDEDFFFVKADKKLIRINYEDILYIEGLKDYVIIRLETGRVITLQTMKSLEDRLPEQTFRRVHRSYIVNITKITAVQGNAVELMENGKVKSMPIGKNYKDELIEKIKEKKW